VFTGHWVNVLPVYGLNVEGLSVYYTFDPERITVRGIVEPGSPRLDDVFYGEEVQVPDYDAMEEAMCEKMKATSIDDVAVEPVPCGWE
jgi:hypothetical protein